MEPIICKTCGEGKPDGDFQCKGERAAPSLCKVCFAEKKREYDRSRMAKKANHPDEIERRRAYRFEYNNSLRGKAKIIEYRQKPEVKEYMRLYNQKPEVKGKRKKYNQKPEVKHRHSLSSLARSQRLDVKEQARAHLQNPEVKARRSEYFKQYVTDNANKVSDVYVKEVIRGKTKGVLKAKDIPPELIELQRQSLILKRTIKQKNKKDEQHDTTDI